MLPTKLADRYLEPGPDPQDQTGESTVWHLHVPGATTPPCGGQYHQPRRTPTAPENIPKRDVLCRRPGCF